MDEDKSVQEEEKGKETENTDVSKKSIVPFSFKGDAREYFKIWVVNLGLSIITLGIYSAWAKVRNRQYIYGSTSLDGSSFRYTANPVGILKGRLIAVAFAVLYSIATRTSIELTLVLVILFVMVLPWLIVKSLRFNTRYTSYRNISLGFDGSYGEAFKLWVMIYLLMPITLGFAYPYILYRQKEFIVSKSRYGTSDFSLSGAPSSFYGIYLTAGCFVVAFSFFFTFISGALLKHVNFGGLSVELMPLIINFAVLPFYLLIFVYIRVTAFNYIMNNTSLAGMNFRSTQKVKDMFRIYFTNAVAIFFSLGLMIPWAKIRTVRYKMDQLRVETDKDLEGFVAGEEEQVSAYGEEFGEVFDIDIAL